MKVMVPVPSVKSRSRKVNKMVQLKLGREAIAKEHLRLSAEIDDLERSLTGGQMAEVKRILDEYR